MIRRAAALFLMAAIMIFASVVSYAANTGVSYRSDDDQFGMDRGPASASDLREADLNGQVFDLDCVPSVSIRAGEVVVLADQEDSGSPGALLSQMRSVADYGYYIDIDSSTVGSRIYVPSEYAEGSFYVDSSGHLFGMRNSAFTCYSGQYSIRFPAYSTPQYRVTSGTGYTWQDITLTYSDSPNVSVMGARENFWNEKMQALFLVMIGGLCVCLYLKR